VYSEIAILAAFVFVYSIFAARLEKTPVNGAIIFVAFGIACGPVGFSLINFDVDAEGIRTLAEFTLAMVLFTDAANADLGVLKSFFRIPQRLLLIALPLVILLGFGLGVLLFDQLSLLEVALLATILAPTDAALGKAVITNPSVPARIREGLNVESGLNDGICVPVLLIFLAFATGAAGEEGGAGLVVHRFVSEIGIGAAAGIGCILVGTAFFWGVRPHGRVGEIWMQATIPAIALTCFATAQFLGGSGFIACFVAGLIGGASMRQHKHALLLAAEGTGEVLALLTWVVFGAVVAGATLEHFSWDVLIYAVLSLTLIRMVPSFVVLTGTGLTVFDKLVLGWFGPRGLASIVFIVIVLNEHLPGGETLRLVVAWTIILSVIAHGATAYPLAALYARRQKSGEDDPLRPENHGPAND
jgi:NhaP-type Na+/H+ or K+/H+ antiporter